MKDLLTVLMMIGLLWPTASLSQNPARNYAWSKGDYVTAAIVCRDEESILKVLKADTISEEETLAIMYALTSLGKCMRAPMPLPFYVKEVFVEYKDFADRPSVRLEIARADKKEDTFGYGSAAGTQKTENGISKDHDNIV